MFLYKEVLGQKADWIELAVRAQRPKRLPVVLTQDEVRTVLAGMRGVPRLCATVLYGAGLRLMECAQLRVKDLDFSRGEILVRDGKGQKDRLWAATHNLSLPPFPWMWRAIRPESMSETRSWEPSHKRSPQL